MSVADEMRKKLDDFAREGLRTLVFGYRCFSEVEWEAWRVEHALYRKPNRWLIRATPRGIRLAPGY